MQAIFKDRGFLIHFSVYVLVNVILTAVNLLTTPDKLLFYWPLIGWGVGLLGHAYLTYRNANRPVRRAPISRSSVGR